MSTKRSGRMSLTRRISSKLFGSKLDEDGDEEKKSDEHGTSPPSDDDGSAPSFLGHPTVGDKAGAIIQRNLDRIPDDSLVKVTRQLDFWATRGIPDDEFLDLTERLVHAASWRSRLDDSDDKEHFTVPKVRFGRTELRMPIVTCGGMRVQQTWLPDFVPLLAPSKKKVLKGDSQRNLKDVVKACLRVGLNHFETARFYGTSEMQFVDALGELLDSGEIQRDDFIFQTKVVPCEKRKDWEKAWGQSWAHVGERLGHVDLMSFHGAGDDRQIEWLMDESDDGIYAAAEQLQKEGKIRHIGFSTHGMASKIMNLIESNKFSYVNIHYHFFGSYHAEGTPDGKGGHGNLACVKRALELDMGVFLISPFDKGGKLYRPSATVAETIGPKLTPIAFASLHSWKTVGIHTVSVGFARPSDLDEVLEAAYAYRDGGKFEALTEAETRLKGLAEEKLGKEWVERGMLDVPDCYDERTDGVLVGHVLWLHNLMTAYGMYDFCKERYKSMFAAESAWKDGKSFKENCEKMAPFNAGRPYNKDVDLTEALRDHYDPDLVERKMIELDGWLRDDDDGPTEEERKARGWDEAYSLTVWEEFPGAPNPNISATKVLLQNMTGGRMGITGTGPTKRASHLASSLRTSYRTLSTPLSVSEHSGSEEE